MRSQDSGYILMSKLSCYQEDFGVFSSVSEACHRAVWCGLPGEEFQVVRKSDGAVVASVLAPESKVSLLDLPLVRD